MENSKEKNIHKKNQTVNRWLCLNVHTQLSTHEEDEKQNVCLS